MEGQAASLAFDNARCPYCDAPLLRGSLVTACPSCLNEIYRKELLEHERAAITEQGDRLMIELAQDQKRRQHITVCCDKRWSYCGATVIQAGHRRKRCKPTEMPLGICAMCLAAFEQTVARAKKEATK